MPATVWRCAPRLQLVPLIKKDAAACEAKLIASAASPRWIQWRISAALLSRAIDDDAPLSVREGGMIRAGYSAELDELRDISPQWQGLSCAKWNSASGKRTGIKNLKIGYNRVFGYYIEVTRSFYELVPYRYTRKQTLANCERFITEELKELERKILGAEENAVRLEYQLFCEIRETLKKALAAPERHGGRSENAGCAAFACARSAGK